MNTTVLMHDLFENSYNDLDGGVRSRVLFHGQLHRIPMRPALTIKLPKRAAASTSVRARVNDTSAPSLGQCRCRRRHMQLLARGGVKKHDDAIQGSPYTDAPSNEKTGAASFYDPIALGECTR